ncbi:Rv3235 family protein [Streptomyces afghaniensis]|uniref:Rv3235 family protein n=1 Tax=Streptomyces afghaniensis TaxID=66865 RepID=UPI0009EA702D|nr:Rv3235 family protein [Streptomyces afghaniensis]
MHKVMTRAQQRPAARPPARRDPRRPAARAATHTRQHHTTHPREPHSRSPGHRPPAPRGARPPGSRRQASGLRPHREPPHPPHLTPAHRRPPPPPPAPRRATGTTAPASRNSTPVPASRKATPAPALRDTAPRVPAQHPRRPAPVPRLLPTDLFADLLLAVLSGHRPVHSMLRHTRGRAYDELAWLAERGPLRTRGARPVVRDIGYFEPRPGAIEAFARIGAGDRLRAMAFRLELGQDLRWRCTAVELGGPRPPRAEAD